MEMTAIKHKQHMPTHIAQTAHVAHITHVGHTTEHVQLHTACSLKLQVYTRLFYILCQRARVHIRHREYANNANNAL